MKKIGSFISIVATVVFILVKCNGTPKEFLEDVTGVWSTDDEELVEVNFVDKKQKTIKLANQIYNIEIKDTDLENGIVVFYLGNKEKGVIWTLRKIIEDDDTFNLTITGHNGESFDLGFVRNL